MLLQLASLFAAVSTFLAVPHATKTYSTSPSVSLVNLPPLSAESIFLLDTVEARILHAKNPDVQYPMASITKLMAALVLLDKAPDWERLVTFEARDRRNGDRAYLFPGETVRLADAWDLMLVASSNDAAMLLTRSVFGSEEAGVAAMNEKAKALGLRSVSFADPTGLNLKNVGTAREIAALAQFSLSQKKVREAVLKETFTFAPKGKPSRQVRSTNQLLSWFQLSSGEIFGGKTGHIEEDKYNLVFAARSHGRELIAVVLGSATNDARFQDMSKLLQWGFEN